MMVSTSSICLYFGSIFHFRVQNSIIYQKIKRKKKILKLFLFSAPNQYKTIEKEIMSICLHADLRFVREWLQIGKEKDQRIVAMFLLNSAASFILNGILLSLCLVTAPIQTITVLDHITTSHYFLSYK